MNKELQRDWGVVREELNAKLQQSGRDYRKLSLEAGVSYHAARRFALNGAENQTETARKLCVYFGISLYETAKVQDGQLEELTSLMREVWDGSRAHAELLARLIRSTMPFKVRNRHNGR